MNTKRLKGISMLLLFTLIFTALVLPISAAGDTSPNPIPSGNTSEKEESTTETKPFDLTPEGLAALYTAESGKFTVRPVWDETDEHTFATLIGSFKDARSAHLDARDAALSIEASFLVVLKDGGRTIYTLNKNNRIVVNGAQGFTIPAEDYTTLLAIYNKKTNYSNYLQWLIYMSPSKVIDVTYDTGNGETSLKEQGYLKEAVQLMRGTRSYSATSAESYDLFDVKLSPGNGTILIKIYFEKDIAYSMHFVGNTLYLESSDYRIGRKYTTVAGEGARLLKALEHPATSFAKTEEAA